MPGLLVIVMLLMACASGGPEKRTPPAPNPDARVEAGWSEEGFASWYGEPYHGREAEVIVNDRGPFVAGRIVDLSRAAADRLGIIGPGIAPVRLTVVRAGDGMPGATCWEVQVGAFAKVENVARAERDLASRALATRTAPAGGGLTRVRVTGLTALSSARALARELDGTYPGAAPVPCGGGR
jgi:rare lipoprotein A (peptidoglycan hydrolase)